MGNLLRLWSVWIIGIFVPAVLLAGYWTQETVDAIGNVGHSPSMALDAYGNPHISYHTGSFPSGGVLKYAYKSGGSWHIETVVGASGKISMALDAYGNPHISYHTGGFLSEGDLKYAYKSGGSWHIETVDTVGWDVGHASSITLDANGNPHIGYATIAYLHVSGPLKYAYKSGGTWHIQTVDATADVGFCTSIALDANGNPHISYDDFLNVDLKYAYMSGGTWHTQTVDTTGNVSYYFSLALDASGNPHISYYDQTNGDLKYAYKSGGTWHIETVDVIGDVGYSSSLVLDASNNPHISYYDATNGDLKYATTAIQLIYPNGGEVWRPGETQIIRWTGAGPIEIYFSPDGINFQMLISGVSGGSFPFLVPPVYTENAVMKISRDSFPSSVDFSDGFFSIRQPIPVRKFYDETVDTTGIVGYDNSLAVDATHNPHISYFDDDHMDLKYAYKTGETWHTETVDTTGWVGQYTSLALDNNDNPHISYYDNTNKDLKYAYKSSDTWHIETVDATGDVGWYTSLALDNNDNPHISYYDNTNKDLKYAYKSGGTWHVETVGTYGDVGRYTSLALDHNGNPHISYYDWTNGNLCYAYKSGGTWGSQIVDTTGIVGQFTSLALDDNNNPHISYYDATNDNLKYTYKSGDTWYIQTVDTYGNVGQYTSLALDDNNNPHISYYDATNKDLKYAYMSGDTWYIQTVDTTGWVGQYSSLALDNNDNPHISYFDDTYGDLKYATTAISLFHPVGGETWTVGANAILQWGGPKFIDVYISLQGGNTWQSLLQNIAGTGYGNTWRYSFQVPHFPTHYAKVKIVYADYDPSNPLYYATSDTFFTIQATIVLLEFNAEIGNDGKVHLTWQTDPGPQDLLGYHVYRLNADGSETRLTASPLRETTFADDPVPGIRGYALGAVNGLGTEYRIGEISLIALKKPIVILPTVVKDEAQIYFNVPSFVSEDNQQDVKLFITDITGRVVMKLLDRPMTSGVHSLRFHPGMKLQTGIYFLVLKVNDEHQKTTRLQIVR